MNTQSQPTPWILWSLPDQQAEQDCACAAVENARIYQNSQRAQAEGDCACANALQTALAFAPPGGATWQLAPDLYHASLPDNHTLAFNPLGPAGVVVLNEPARAMLDSFAHPRPLTNATETQLAALGLLVPVLNPRSPTPNVQSPIPNLLSATTLTVWLHVTNACNLRCAYCYLSRSDEAMDEATGRTAIEAVFRSAARQGFGSVKLKYAGGEPTLNFELIRHLHQYARVLAQQIGLELREVVLSNGVALSNPMLGFIRDAGMRLMISLDGVGAAHDAQRTFASGRGSFALVAQGVDRAISRGVRPHLSITVTSRSVQGVADAVAFALDRDLLFNLNFYRANGRPGGKEDLLAEDDRLIAAGQAAFAIIEARLPRQSLIAALVDRASFNAPHDRACGAGHTYMVIDPRGRVARCQMEIERAITDVFVDDPLSAIQSKYIGFQNVAVDEKEGCRDCQWRYRCAGGCPLLTYRVIGRSDVKSPYCNVYKALYPEALRLEGLRLLKWQASPN